MVLVNSMSYCCCESKRVWITCSLLGKLGPVSLIPALLFRYRV